MCFNLNEKVDKSYKIRDYRACPLVFCEQSLCWCWSADIENTEIRAERVSRRAARYVSRPPAFNSTWCVLHIIVISPTNLPTSQSMRGKWWRTAWRSTTQWGLKLKKVFLWWSPYIASCLAFSISQGTISSKLIDSFPLYRVIRCTLCIFKVFKQSRWLHFLLSFLPTHSLRAYETTEAVPIWPLFQTVGSEWCLNTIPIFFIDEVI